MDNDNNDEVDQYFGEGLIYKENGNLTTGGIQTKNVFYSC